MSIKDRSKRVLAGGAAAVGLTLGVAALAGAATTPDQNSPTQPAAAEQQESQEPTLNGSIQAPDDESISEADEAKTLEGLAKVSAADAEKAALAAVPGGTVNEKAALENENGSVVYEVDVTDPNGQSVEVKVDAGSGNVLAQEAEEAEGTESEDDESDEGTESEDDEANEGDETNEVDDGTEANEATEAAPQG